MIPQPSSAEEEDKQIFIATDALVRKLLENEAVPTARGMDVRGEVTRLLSDSNTAVKAIREAEAARKRLKEAERKRNEAAQNLIVAYQTWPTDLPMPPELKAQAEALLKDIQTDLKANSQARQDNASGAKTAEPLSPPKPPSPG